MKKQQIFWDLFFLGVIVLTAFGVKFFYANCQTGDLKFFLKPVSILVSLFSGAAYRFSESAGYLFPALDIVIERSCSGVNFFVMAFCMVAISILPFYKQQSKKMLALLVAAAMAYVFTILANTSRIIIAINSLQFSEQFPSLASDTMHLIQGSFVYIFFLILCYLLAHYSNKKISQIYA